MSKSNASRSKTPKQQKSLELVVQSTSTQIVQRTAVELETHTVLDPTAVSATMQALDSILSDVLRQALQEVVSAGLGQGFGHTQCVKQYMGGIVPCLNNTCDEGGMGCTGKFTCNDGYRCISRWECDSKFGCDKQFEECGSNKYVTLPGITDQPWWTDPQLSTWFTGKIVEFLRPENLQRFEIRITPRT